MESSSQDGSQSELSHSRIEGSVADRPAVNNEDAPGEEAIVEGKQNKRKRLTDVQAVSQGTTQIFLPDVDRNIFECELLIHAVQL